LFDRDHPSVPYSRHNASAFLLAKTNGNNAYLLSWSLSFVRVRRETGKKSVVRVHHGEGVAIHIDPESCADAREGIGEALAGERIGQAMRWPRLFEQKIRFVKWIVGRG
jgi:hypothetical protein